MSRRQTWSLPWAANEASDTVSNFFFGFPHELSYTMSQRLAYRPHLALQRGVNTLALMHSPFSLVFHLHFITLGEKSLCAFLRTAVKRIGMFPHRFVMRCDGVPLSCSANRIWGSLGLGMKKYAVFLFVRSCFVTLALPGICEPEQRLCNGCTEAVN